MSKFFESLLEIMSNILWMLCWCAAIYYAYDAWNSDWNLNKLFDQSIKKEKWITVEKELGTYPNALERRWVSSIFKNIDVKTKIRDSITNDNKGKIDFAYEVMAKLTRPVFSKTNEYKEVDYEIVFDFKFIDEDGFVICTIPASYFKPTHIHEEYEQTNLDYNWDDSDDKYVVAKILLSDKVEEKIAKRTTRIICKPEIVIKRRLKNEEDDSFETLWKKIEERNKACEK